jgi:hypothetical protein
MPQRARKGKQRAVVDTSVPVAGIAGFREPYLHGKNPSADLLHEWGEQENFVWLYSEDILDEYKAMLRRLRVRPNVIGKVQMKPSVGRRLQIGRSLGGASM